MIYNWDIITRLDETSSGNQHFLLVIDGSERDAHLIAKKLSGYVTEPIPAEEPFAYAFELPTNASEDTLEKIRTAVREAIDQIHKINQFAPGGTLGSPLFTGRTPVDDPFFDLSQASITATGSFFNGIEDTTHTKPVSILQNTLDKTQPSTASQQAASTEPPLNISDKDMLIKDMENTLLGKMPEDELLSENTKLEVFKHAEDANSIIPSHQRAKKLDELTNNDKEAALEDSLNDAFERKLEDQKVDLEELQTVTNTITEKDLEFVKHAKTEPNLSAVENKQPQQAASMQLPEEVALGNTIPPYQDTASSQGKRNLPDITVREQSMDVLEKTFNLETTLTTEIMRAQYEKSIRRERPTTTTTPNEDSQRPIVHPAQTMLRATNLKKKSGKSPSTNNTGEHSMEEHAEEKTFFRIRRKQQQAPKAPQQPKPAVPGTPQPPSKISMPSLPDTSASPSPAVTVPPVPKAAPAPAPIPAPTPAPRRRRRSR